MPAKIIGGVLFKIIAIALILIGVVVLLLALASGPSVGGIIFALVLIGLGVFVFTRGRKLIKK